MAFVRKHKGASGKESPFWYGVIHVPDESGRMRRIEKSTKVRHRGKAEALAREWERQARACAAGRVTRRQAQTAIDSILETVTGEKTPRYTVEEWCALWLRSKETVTKEKTLQRYRLPVERFLAHIGKARTRPLQSLSPSMFFDFREAEAAKGKSATSCNLDIKVLKMPFFAAVKAGYLETNPVDALIPMADDAETKEPFTVAQIESLLQVAQGEWRGLILCGLYTGARLGDVARLRWRNIDLPGGMIRFVPQKTDRRKKKNGRELVLPIHPTLAAYLLGLPSCDDPETYLFPEAAERGIPGRSGLSSQFARIMDAAGIIPKVTRKRAAAAHGRSSGRTGRALSFHSLRHTLTSILHNAGVSVEIRQKFTGHASPEMNMRYAHTEADTLRDALANVPGIKLES